MRGQSSRRSRSSSRRHRENVTILLGPAQFDAVTSAVCVLRLAGVTVRAIFDADACMSYPLTPHQHYSGWGLLRISFVDFVDVQMVILPTNRRGRRVVQSIWFLAADRLRCVS